MSRTRIASGRKRGNRTRTSGRGSSFDHEPGRTNPGKAWIREPGAVDEALAPGFGAGGQRRAVGGEERGVLG